MPDRTRTIDIYPTSSTMGLPRPEGVQEPSISVSANGQAIRLFVHRDSATVWVSNLFDSSEITLPNLSASFPAVQTLPDSEILVVDSRCQRIPSGGYELNATVYGTDAAVRRRFLLGDGIEHVQTDLKGNIWVGYFDEGIYGNFGSELPNGPFGSSGLSCFSGHGEKLWDFQPPEGIYNISDCYALNVVPGGAWCYYYTGFPFVHVDAGWNTRTWKTKTAGGHQFAVLGERILLYGGYRENRTICQLLRLKGTDAEVLTRVSLHLPQAVDLSKATVIGRADVLHVFFEDWYKFTVGSIAETRI